MQEIRCQEVMTGAKCFSKILSNVFIKMTQCIRAYYEKICRIEKKYF